MADGCRMILHLRIRVEQKNRESLLHFLREAVPFYENTGGITIRLLQNEKDPSQLIEVVEYENREIYERDQVRVDTDPQMQGYLQNWHSLLDGPVEVEIYKEITDEIGGRLR